MSCALDESPPIGCGREAAPRPEELIGRRASSRHRIDLAARFVSIDVNVRVQLEDVSPSGACIRLISHRALGEGRLLWLDYEQFVRPVWQADLQCGLEFDERLDADRLRRTLEFGEADVDNGVSTMRRLASAWVHGPGDY